MIECSNGDGPVATVVDGQPLCGPCADVETTPTDAEAFAAALWWAVGEDPALADDVKVAGRELAAHVAAGGVL